MVMMMMMMAMMMICVLTVTTMLICHVMVTVTVLEDQMMVWAVGSAYLIVYQVCINCCACKNRLRDDYNCKPSNNYNPFPCEYCSPDISECLQKLSMLA